MKLLISCIGLLSALAVVGPAFADEPPVKPKRERAAAPQRAAPQRTAPQRAAPTQTSNWSGGQVGGSNGASSVNNNFVEPGAYICPPGSSFGSTCFETPFQFSGHKAVYTIGPFVGYRWMIGKGPYPGSTVFGIEGDWSWKNAETSLNQSSSTLIAVTGSNFLRTTSSPAPSSRNRTPRSAPVWAFSSRPGVCCTLRAASRSKKSADRLRIPGASALHPRPLPAPSPRSVRQRPQ